MFRPTNYNTSYDMFRPKPKTLDEPIITSVTDVDEFNEYSDNELSEMEQLIKQATKKKISVSKLRCIVQDMIDLDE